MNILITGCAGFIGSWVTEKLLFENKHKIVGLDNFDPYYPKIIKINNMKNFENNTDFKFYECDITNSDKLEKIFRDNNFDVVIHLAAKPGVRNSVLYPLEYAKVNINGTINILNCMKKYSIPKIIFSSSSSVYGDICDKKFHEYATNLKPKSVYALTKKNAEEYIELYSRQYGIKSICLRFFTVYGQRQRPDLAISKFTGQIKNEQILTMYGDGSTYRDYTHVDDIANGIIKSIYYDKTPYEIINLGSECPIKLSEMIVVLERTIGKKANIQIQPVPNEDMQRTYADISKAKKILNYKPNVKFEDGILDFVKSYK